MGWVRVDEGFYDHPKFLAVGPLGMALWIASLAWSSRNLRDGFIPFAATRRLIDFEGLADSETVAARLINAGLWETCEGGFRIHDYLKYQRAAERVEADRLAYHLQRSLAGKARSAGAERTNGRFTKADVTPATTSGPPAGTPAKPPATHQPTVTVTVTDTTTKAKSGARARSAPVHSEGESLLKTAWERRKASAKPPPVVKNWAAATQIVGRFLGDFSSERVLAALMQVPNVSTGCLNLELQEHSNGHALSQNLENISAGKRWLEGGVSGAV